MAKPLPPSPTPIPILPLEIITEILYLLPPKILLRFKTVSKVWLSLITDPNFIKKHLRKSAANGVKIVASDSIGRSYSFVPIKSFLSAQSEMRNGVECEEVEIGFPASTIIGSIDGLICGTIGTSQLFIWNPAMRKFRILPNSEFRDGIRLVILCNRGFIYGFGYDKVNDDYKVVRMVSGSGIGCDSHKVEVYSMKSNSWKRLADFLYGPHHENGLSVCGTLVWPAVSTSAVTTQSVVHGVPVLNIEWKIVALDLGSESYIDVPQPECVHTLRDKLLGVMNGCLCIFAHFLGTKLEVWMMKEFGVRESWTKVATVPYVEKPRWSDALPFYKLLWCSKDGEMIILFRSKLIVYNIRDNIFKYPNVTRLKVLMQASTYVESLVSPSV